MAEAKLGEGGLPAPKSGRELRERTATKAKEGARELVPTEPEAKRARKEGRPSGPTDPNGLRAGVSQRKAPTEAPEERGATPGTEHAPGSDL